MGKEEFIIEDSGVPIPKPIHRGGRPKGSGKNMAILKRMKVGSCIFDVPRKKMQAFIWSAAHMQPPVKISYRLLPYGKSLYAIWRTK